MSVVHAVNAPSDPSVTGTTTKSVYAGILVGGIGFFSKFRLPVQGSKWVGMSFLPRFFAADLELHLDYSGGPELIQRQKIQSFRS